MHMNADSDERVVTAETFEQDVLVASSQTPVLVDFWAPWCGPCKQLMPVLDRLAVEYAGRFTLAKVNTDEQQALAQQIGIRSLPTVVLFKDGDAVAHFMGVQPEGQIRKLLDEHLPPAPEAPGTRAEALRAQGDFAAARTALDEALERDPTNVELRTGLAELHVLEGDIEAARTELSELQNREPQHAAVKRLAALLHFSDVIASYPDARALRERTDPESRSLLAVHSLLAGDHQAALDIWLEQMRTQPSSKPAARENLVKAFDLLGEGEPAVGAARRAMAKLLF
jgi:putative thioredoxin